MRWRPSASPRLRAARFASSIVLLGLRVALSEFVYGVGVPQHRLGARLFWQEVQAPDGLEAVLQLPNALVYRVTRGGCDLRPPAVAAAQLLFLLLGDENEKGTRIVSLPLPHSESR